MRRAIVGALLILTSCGPESSAAPAARLQAPANDQGCVIRELMIGTRLIVSGGQVAVDYCSSKTDAVLGGWTYTMPAPDDRVVCWYLYDNGLKIQLIDSRETAADDNVCGNLKQGNVP